jgi:hypothetical protein
MKERTKSIHEGMAALGEALGFTVSREVSGSLLGLRFEKGYQPRIDLMWSLPLDSRKRKAISWALGLDAAHVTHLPIVGIEIEGTTPTTKTMASDVANLAALGAPLGLLVVSEEGERNIYRRAARAIRTLRRSFGDTSALPFEARWLDLFLSRRWSRGWSPVRTPRNKAPGGGETLGWSRDIRLQLRERGETGGFMIAEPYKPEILPATFNWASANRQLTHTTDPRKGMRQRMSHYKDYLTDCEVDLAWLMPMPAALKDFMVELEGIDPCLREHGLLFSELWSQVAVVAFELESSGGKHAGGGLLNLAAYSMLGLALTPHEATYRGLDATLRTYRPTLGLRGVHIRLMP